MKTFRHGRTAYDHVLTKVEHSREETAQSICTLSISLSDIHFTDPTKTFTVIILHLFRHPTSFSHEIFHQF